MIDHSHLSKSFDFNGDVLKLLEHFRHEKHVFFLDSSQFDPHRGRYSFIGFNPFETFIRKGKDALILLKEKFISCVGNDQSYFLSHETPLTSGIIGCLSYDYGLHQEKIHSNNRDGIDLPDCFFAFYDCVLTIDHFTQKLILSSSGLPETKSHLREKRAQQRLSEITKQLNEYFLTSDTEVDTNFPSNSSSSLELKSNLTKQQYVMAVKKALDHINCGNIYQVNLSQRFEMECNDLVVDPVKLYKDLRERSPSPFGGLMDCGRFQLISNSPERFLHLNGNVVQSRPMKGTRPRGANEQEDQKYLDEITNSSKERAELMMITDLVRNDLGRVCDYGSISVKEMRTIEQYKYVFQATSTVEGILNKNKDCFDVLQACFPGGSVTGCPKIRAMEVIEELEPTRRGMYTGSMGYINFAGNMDFNILIRTLVCLKDKLVFQVGGGIVADSIPEKEYEETLIKAQAIQESLKRSLWPKGSILESKIKS